MIEPIRARADFQRLRRDGHRIRIDPFWCAHLTTPTEPQVRVAFAINRQLGNAVTRNRLRRRIRAILPELDLPPGLYLIGCQPRASELKFATIRERLERLSSRIDRT